MPELCRVAITYIIVKFKTFAVANCHFHFIYHKSTWISKTKDHKKFMGTTFWECIIWTYLYTFQICKTARTSILEDLTSDLYSTYAINILKICPFTSWSYAPLGFPNGSWHIRLESKEYVCMLYSKPPKCIYCTNALLDSSKCLT